MDLRLVALGLVAVAVTVAGCRRRPLEPGDGFLAVPGGRVWYRIAGGGAGTPLLLLHGGPGAPSYYLEPLARLGGERPVVFYDQLGCGRSEHPDDPALWRVERFVQELAALRAGLGLERVHILGHSWGTMLAVDYMLAGPEGVVSLVLASPCLSVARWMRDADKLRQALPEPLQAAIARNEAAGRFDAPEYQEAVQEYYRRHLSRLDPWPTELNRTFAELSQAAYTTMWGPSEFTATGSLRHYDRTGRLGELRLPVLFTAGRYDEATPAATEHYRSLIPGARIRIFENSAHMTMLDEADAYVGAIREFLREVDSHAGQR